MNEMKQLKKDNKIRNLFEKDLVIFDKFLRVINRINKLCDKDTISGFFINTFASGFGILFFYIFYKKWDFIIKNKER